MNKRQEGVLSAIVEEYTKSAIPVGSKVLFEKYNLGVSSATIRNDMVVLEKEGYLYHPHVSAGRIPTDKGFRHFVETMMGENQLSRNEQIHLQKEFLKMKAQNARLTRTTAKLLSSLSGTLAISGIIDKDEFSEVGIRELMSQPEFQELDELCRLAEVLDYIDEKFDTLLKEVGSEDIKIYIGKENPIGEISNCSMIVSPYKLKSGEKGILALIGPKRMEYAKNKSLIEFVKKLLSSSMGVIVIINII